MFICIYICIYIYIYMYIYIYYIYIYIIYIGIYVVFTSSIETLHPLPRSWHFATSQVAGADSACWGCGCHGVGYDGISLISWWTWGDVSELIIHVCMLFYHHIFPILWDEQPQLPPYHLCFAVRQGTRGCPIKISMKNLMRSVWIYTGIAWFIICMCIDSTQ